jgi:hypothetical protein
MLYSGEKLNKMKITAQQHIFYKDLSRVQTSREILELLRKNLKR